MQFNFPVTVVVGTYGDDYWAEIAQTALASVEAQTVPVQGIHVHGHTLAEARNEGAERAQSEWLCFLDADDTLAPNYCEEILNVEAGDIRRPSTIGVYPDGTTDLEPVMIPERDLRTANYIVLSSAVRREAFMRVGGFREMDCLEDWDLFIRLVLDGQKIVGVPAAVLKIGVNMNSRNQNQRAHTRAYQRIKNDYREAFSQHRRQE